MNEKTTPSSRVVGFDIHPDSFTAARTRGRTPAEAIVEKIHNKIPMDNLLPWSKTHLTPEDLIVMEASGNSFEVVRKLESIGLKALVLESCQMGKLKVAHANNDKISAVRIAKAYLAGTAKQVWVPDPLTQERRDWFHAYNKTVKRTTQMNNSIGSFLSDNGVRLPQGLPSPQKREEVLRKAKDWSPRQWQVIEGRFLEFDHAQQQRDHWSSLIAQEVLADPLLLSMTRLCGVRDVVAFSLGAIIGDINRFASPKNLVAYMGLNPAFDDSGENTWRGGIGGHGRKDLRSLLIEAAQSILRSNHSLAQWGKKLMARKGSVKLAVAAVARRLTVAIWYLMMGRWTQLDEIDDQMSRKVGKIITKVGKPGLAKLGKTRKQLREEACRTLKTGRTYVLKTKRKIPPRPTDEPQTLAQEYGLA